MANEDVTVLGEELSELHYETLTTDLGGEGGAELAEDYSKALDAYDQAKKLLRTTEGTEVVTEVHSVLEDARFHLACVVARQEDRPLPERLPSCFFNAQHGPSHSKVEWAPPPDGEPRLVPACLADVNRIANQHRPAMRMIRVGDQLVPWMEADTAFRFVRGKVDMRRFKELRSRNHGESALYGADPTTKANRFNVSGM